MNPLPKHIVIVLVFIPQDDSILLAKQGYGKLYWSLPGGLVEPGETLEKAALREAKEETGLDIRLKRVVGLYSKVEEDALAITFEGEVTGGGLAPSHEILECRYFCIDKLPQNCRPHLVGRLRDYQAQRAATFFRTD